METDEIIARLSAASDRRRAGPVVTIVVASGLSLAVVSAIAVIWFGVGRGAAVPSVGHAVLLRFVLFASLAASALSILRDLSTPGRRSVSPLLLIGPPVAIMAVLVLHDLVGGDRSLAPGHIDHSSWLTCLWQSAALAVPTMVVLFAALRRLAPTSLERVGGYVGLLAGSVGAMSHCLHQTGGSAADVSAYAIGIGLVVGLGALLGPPVLRWR